MKCPTCSKELPDDAGICPACASPQKGRSGDEVGRFQPGTVLGGRNRIVSLLGQGGMGEVYRAEDLKLDQPVALKFLPESMANDPGGLARFLGEVKIARQISHPNICRIYDVGEVDGLHFISMEYIDGEDLAALVERVGQLPEAKAISIARQLCQGLAAVHEQGVLHRDLKPTNLMLDNQGRVRITDFGLAAMARTVSGPEIMFGTPAYMAPEQHSGGEVSAKSDLYSLGLVLYMLFTGRPAFQAESLADLVRQHQTLSPTPPSALVNDLTPMIEQIILRCLKKDPQDRPFSALAIAAALPSGDALMENETLKTRLVSDLAGQDQWANDLGNEKSRLLRQLHDRITRNIRKKHQGQRIDEDGPLQEVFFDRPIQAVHYALAYQEALAKLSQGESVRMAARIGIHISQFLFVDDQEKTTKLSSLAQPGQILLTRGAFDLARQGSATGFERVRWLAHGKYEIAGIAEPLEIFEVGFKGISPMKPPRDSDLARRQMVQDTISGWRPAPGLEMPQRPNWQIERKLGEGGFGEVWLAAHAKTNERRVFKFCYDPISLRSLQREITLFRLLKETLGHRDDITRLLDWNFDEAPYFIESEYTEGGSLSEWAAEQGHLEQVPLDTRLEIVAQVAVALAAAHSVGVLHKDVKPGNVLISTDSQGHVRARLNDFGVGLITQKQRLVEAGITVLGMTELAVETAGSASVGGTHLYTAPEILEAKPATLQADVYALGVMLYQMVVGDFSRVLAPGWDRDFEDELLAEDIAAAVDGSPERRLSSAVLLAERLRGLEERRQQRVTQHQEKAARRRESEEAAQAKAALAKSRQRRKLGALAIIVLTLFAGAMYLQSRRTAHQAEVASQITEFLVNLFKVSDPEVALGNKITAREILDKGVAEIEHDLREQAQPQARLMHIMGGVYLNLGLYDESAELFEKALATRRRIHGKNHPEVGQSLNALADVETKRGNHDRAEALGREALKTHRKLHGNHHSDVAASLEIVALVMRRKGDFDAAEDLFRQSLTMRQELSGDDHEDVAHSLDNLAELFMEDRQFDQAEPLYQKALEIRRRLLENEHPDVAKSLDNLALVIHSKRTDLDAAEKLYLESLSMRRRLLGDEHPDIAGVLDNLGLLYSDIGKFDESEKFFNDSIHMYRQRLGPEHPYVANVLTHMGFLFSDKGELDAAEQSFKESLKIYRKQLGDEHSYVAIVQEHLGRLLLLKKEYKEAEDTFRQRLEALQREHPSERWEVSHTSGMIGACLSGLGRHEEGEPLLLKSYSLLEKRPEKDAEFYAQEILHHIVRLYEAWDKPEAAEGYRSLLNTAP